MEGLLWYDGDPKKPWTEKVLEAGTRYHEKFGRWPTVCEVPTNAQNVPGTVTLGKVNPVRVLSAPNILTGHLFIGENGDQHETES